MREMKYKELGEMARDFCLGFDLLIFADIQPKFSMLTHQVHKPKLNYYFHKDFGEYYKDRNGNASSTEQDASKDDLLKLTNAPFKNSYLLQAGNYCPWVYPDEEHIFALSELENHSFMRVIRNSSFLQMINRSTSTILLVDDIQKYNLPFFYIPHQILLELAIVSAAASGVAMYCDPEYFDFYGEEAGYITTEKPNKSVRNAAHKLLNEIKKQNININPFLSELRELADGVYESETPKEVYSYTRIDLMIREITARSNRILNIENHKQGRFPSNAIMALLIDVVKHYCISEDQKENLKKQIKRIQNKYAYQKTYPITESLTKYPE